MRDVPRDSPKQHVAVIPTVTGRHEDVSGVAVYCQRVLRMPDRWVPLVGSVQRSVQRSDPRSGAVSIDFFSCVISKHTWLENNVVLENVESIAAVRRLGLGLVLPVASVTVFALLIQGTVA